MIYFYFKSLRKENLSSRIDEILQSILVQLEKNYLEKCMLQTAKSHQSWMEKGD